MIADAVKADNPLRQRIIVDTQSIRYTLDDKRYLHFTPRAVQQSIVDFDEGITPDPFRFRLQPAVQVVQADSRSRAKDPAKAKVRTHAHKGRPGKEIKFQKQGGQLPPKGKRSSRAFGMRNMRVNQREEAAS
jgi:hypothetical protein